jgi:S-adenosylmethionine:tRNA ribosyltransferase-isomerase
VARFAAIVFGAGDYRTPTEHRPLPPPLAIGDALRFGSGGDMKAGLQIGLDQPLVARVVSIGDHPRLIDVEFDRTTEMVWAALVRHGRPIQYAYVSQPLAIWDTWTRIAARPVAFEAPSAGFVLDWSMLKATRDRGARFATITHAAGISSTGDPDLDGRLPLDEPYEIPQSTAVLIAQTRSAGGRVIAIGTTVVRALEAAAGSGGQVHPGPGIATGRLGSTSRLAVVDALVSGMHEPGTSHYELLKAFADQSTLEEMTADAEARGYRTHEYGDFTFITRNRGADPVRRRAGVARDGAAGPVRPACDYAIRTLRGNCELSSRNVFFRDSSAVVGWLTPFASVARDTIVCSPGEAPSHL